MSKILKPCPFCGSKPKWDKSRRNFEDDKNAFYSLYCDNDNCGVVETYWHPSKELAIAAWNTRPAADVERLVEAARALYKNACTNTKKAPVALWADLEAALEPFKK